MNGLFGARPDENRVFVPGPREYYVDGVLVTEDVFRAEFEKAYPGCQLFEER